MDNFPILEFHDADGIRRLPVVGEDKFCDPQIISTQNPLHGKPFLIRLGNARGLYIVATSDALS